MKNSRKFRFTAFFGVCFFISSVVASLNEVVALELDDLPLACQTAIQDGLKRLYREPNLFVEYRLGSLDYYDDVPKGRIYRVSLWLSGSNSINVLDSPALLADASQMMMSSCSSLGLVSFSPGPLGVGTDYVVRFGIFPDGKVRSFTCANENSRDLDVEIKWGQQICL